MKLGFVSAILPDLNLGQVFDVAAEIGYDCIEVMCWPLSRAERRYAGVTHIEVTSLDQDKITEIQGHIGRTGVTISGLGYYPNPLSSNAQEAQVAQEHLVKVIDAAKILGLSNVNSFIGRDWTKSVEENWETFLKVWKPLVAHAEKSGVKIGIENCPMLFSKDEWPGGKNLAVSPVIWRKMFSDIPSDHFGLNFDPSHCIWQQMDYLRHIREFSSKFFHVHAKDARIDHHKLNEVGILAHPATWHTPKLPGMGDVQWGSFFSILTDVGYHGAVCVEVEDRAFEHSLDDRKAALRQSHNYLRNFVPRRPAYE